MHVGVVSEGVWMIRRKIFNFFVFVLALSLLLTDNNINKMPIIVHPRVPVLTSIEIK